METNNVILKYLTNPYYQNVITARNKNILNNNENDNESSISKEDIQFYRKRIVALTKDMLKGINTNNEVKKEHEEYVHHMINYFKMVDRKDILQKQIASEADYELIEQYTKLLFERGKQLAARQGLILVDTKYEFGKIDDTIYLMDEIHTPDSSRYFYSDGFEKRQVAGEKQLQLSKEFVREWLINNNFMGKEGQVVPEMSDEWITEISNRYIELYEKVIGEKFIPQILSEEENFEKIVTALKILPV